MALESGSFIDDLVSANPPQSDSLTQAAGHLRLIKATIKASFPNITGAMTATQAELNAIAARESDYQYVPAGVINPFAGATLPDGYLWCNGDEVSRTTYDVLFAAIGTQWGSAAAGTFTLPNLKDRFLVGKADMGSSTDAAIIDSLLTSTTLGATYDGEGAIDTITLATTNIPAHTHSFSDSFSGTTSSADTNHYHSVNINTSSGGDHSHSYTRYSGDVDNIQGNGGNDNILQSSSSQSTSTNGNHSHNVSGNTAYQSSTGFGNYVHSHTFSGSVSGTTGSAGDTTAFTVAILPPCAVVNYIIKT
jgi:microcystin-dependent protein